MQAWLLNDFRGLSAMQLAEVADPTASAGEVVVDIEYAALNPADRYLSQGEYPAKPKLPHVLGRDGVGIISSVGTNVSDFKIGQRVLIIRGDAGVHRWGTLAQRVAVSADSLATIPTGWSIQESACAALVYITAHQALTQWGDLPPGIVLITGASGGVGVASLQLAKALGHTVVALSRDSAKRENLHHLGADHVIDPTDPQWPANLKKTLGAARVDLAIDNIGGSMLPQVIETMGHCGKISVVGRLAGVVPNFNTGTLFFRRLRIGGVAISTNSASESQAAWHAMLDLLARTGAKPVIDSVHSFASLPTAFDRLAAGPMGKVLIEIRKSQSDPVG
jgi:NADPH:quinone reductase